MKFSLQSVPISKLTGNNLARSKRSEMFRKALHASVKDHGVLQPVLCCVDGDFFRLVAGFGRVDAATHAGYTEVPANVCDTLLPDVDLRILACQENNLKENMALLDQIGHLDYITREKKISATAAGQLIGLKQSMVSKITCSGTLGEDVKLMLSEAGIGYSIAYLLSQAPADKHLEFAKRLIKEKWTRDRLITELKPQPKRSLVFEGDVKVQLSYPVEAGYEMVRANLKNLLEVIARHEKNGVPFDLLSRMVQS